MRKHGSSEAVTAARMAAVLGVTPRWLRILVDEGFAVRTGRGQYDLAGTVQGALRRAAQERKGDTRLASENRVREARAREIELRNLKQDNILIEMEEALAVVDEIVGMFVSELSGLPARFTRDQPERERLEEDIHDLVNRVRARFHEEATSLRQSGGTGGPAEEDAARPLGSSAPSLPSDHRSSGPS
jgi:phage terminase Nu1 subunit (DNA packaging protein)